MDLRGSDAKRQAAKENGRLKNQWALLRYGFGVVSGSSFTLT